MQHATLSRRAIQVAAVSLGLLGLLAAPTAQAEETKPFGFLVSEDGKTRLPLAGAKVVVGSGADAGARIAHSTVAERHAVLRFEAGAVYVDDLGSRFGTLAAGAEVRKGKPFRIVQRTLLTFGASSWAFEWGDRDTIPPTQKAKPAPKRDAAAAEGKAAPSPRKGK